MKKNVITQQFTLVDYAPESLLKIVDQKLMIKEIKRQHKAKQRLTNDVFWVYYDYTKLDYIKYYQYIAEYCVDHYSRQYGERLIMKDFLSAVVLPPGASINFHNHIDDWDYVNNSYDVSFMYPLYVPKNSKSGVMFRYDNGRYKKQRWRIPIVDRQIIGWSSETEHCYQKNISRETMILLVMRCAYE